MYDDRDDIGANAAVAQRVGHKFLGRKFDDAYQSMRDSTELFCVKTHDVPIDQGKAICIVRDGRSASYSYWHYQRDFGRREDATLADTLIGFTPFGSWSDHLDAWNPMERPYTLLLRYEQLLAEPEEQIRRISDFLELPPLHPWKNDFDQLHQLDPRFFRKGSNEPSVDYNEAEDSLFWLLHASWMSRLGYAPAHRAATAASRSARRLLYECLARHQGKVNSLNLALDDKVRERQLREEELQELHRLLLDASNRLEETTRRLNSAEQEVASLSRFPLPRAWIALRSSGLARVLAAGRPLRTSIAGMLTVLAALAHGE